jgi:hypothetical protein
MEEHIKSKDTQTQYFDTPKVEKRIIQIKLVHAIITALIFGISLIVSTTLFVNNVTTRLSAAEISIIKINTESIPALQKVDDNSTETKNQLVRYVGILTKNLRDQTIKRGEKWSNDVPSEFLDLMK